VVFYRNGGYNVRVKITARQFLRVYLREFSSKFFLWMVLAVLTLTPLGIDAYDKRPQNIIWFYALAFLMPALCWGAIGWVLARWSSRQRNSHHLVKELHGGSPHSDPPVLLLPRKPLRKLHP
jgi:cytochrome b